MQEKRADELKGRGLGSGGGDACHQLRGQERAGSQWAEE